MVRKENENLSLWCECFTIAAYEARAACRWVCHSPYAIFSGKASLLDQPFFEMHSSLNWEISISDNTHPIGLILNWTTEHAIGCKERWHNIVRWVNKNREIKKHRMVRGLGTLGTDHGTEWRPTWPQTAHDAIMLEKNDKLDDKYRESFSVMSANVHFNFSVWLLLSLPVEIHVAWAFYGWCLWVLRALKTYWTFQ